MRKIDAYVKTPDSTFPYEYFCSTTQFTTCKEFVAHLTKRYPGHTFKAKLSKGVPNNA